MIILENLLQEIYPQDYRSILKQLTPLLDSLDHIDPTNWDWYKHGQLYVTYPDGFTHNNQTDLHSLTNQLSSIKDLGFDAVHILPFLKSPLIDAGFDISDYRNAREDLGGNSAAESLLSKAAELDIRVFIDLVLNHTSNQHEWFQKAQTNNKFYRDFYTHTVTKPTLVKTYSDKDGDWATYIIEDKEISIRIIFPEQAGPLPHWEQGEDGYWYYHTFYPHQIDVEWNNPDVFVEFAKIFVYWAKKGVNYRLDAIPFIAKDIIRGVTESSQKTHQIVQALNHIVKKVSPNSVFLVEANQPIKVTKQYFGSEGIVESDLAYNFQLNHGLWSALVSQTHEHIWEVLDLSQNIPDWGQWITFLRNHDQLSLEFMDEDMRLVLHEELAPKGLSFMEGFGISGRTSPFLDNSPERIVMAHALLASLPGMPAIYYGDEIGYANNPEYMEQQTQMKKSQADSANISHDTRDINRGPIDISSYSQEYSQAIFQQLKLIFNTRKKMLGIATKTPSLINLESDTIFAARYDFDGPDIAIFINLSDKHFTQKLDLVGKEILSLQNGKLADQALDLPAYAVLWTEIDDHSEYALHETQ